MALDNFRRIDMKINRANDYQIETQFVKEGDYNGRELVVQITDAGEVSNQSGVSLNLGWKHNSAGNSGLDPFTVVDASKGIFKITYPTEMLIAGDVTASIQVLESGRITLTRNFKITVENNPIDEGAIVSENSFTVLQEALIKVNDLEDNYAPRLNEVTAQLAQYANEEVVANRLGLQQGQDMAVIVQSLLDDSSVGKVRVLEGDYTLSKKIVIPEGKELILSGDNGGNFLNNSEADPSVFTKIHPTFDGDYCFEISNRSSLKGGFINCEGMTSGGAVLVDFSQKEVGRAVIKTNIAGGAQWGVTGILLNGDRPTGTTPGFAYYLDIECGIDRVGNGVHLKRRDTYTMVDKTVNGLAWINGLKIRGEMNGCQRYVFFDTAVNDHAGGSSRIQCRLQGGPVPDANIPSLEIGGNDSFLDCIFHDIGDRPDTNQKIRYKIKGANIIVMKEQKGSIHNIDQGTNTIFLGGTVNDRPTSITELDDGSTVEDGWYIRAGNVATINLRLPAVAMTTAWKKILTLPIPSTATVRGHSLGAGGKRISIWVFGSNLSVIADEAVSGVHIQFSYPVN